MERHEGGGKKKKIGPGSWHEDWPGTRGEKNGGGRGRRRVSGAAEEEEDTVANNPPRDAIWNP